VRFSVLWHAGGVEPHFDLLFELPMRIDLAGWAMARSPELPGVAPIAPTAPHRATYLNYAGPVHPRTEGPRPRRLPSYVRRWDRGELRLFAQQNDLFRAGVTGRRLNGIIEMRRRGEDWEYRYVSAGRSCRVSPGG